VLSGDNASEYETQVRAGFGLTLADGMKRIAATMENAARSAKASAAGEHP
jgi:hypothetical protein